ncbi:MAG: hypothetical protein JSV96_17190, partial [Candidatus Aminicenantes bacterium]
IFSVIIYKAIWLADEERPPQTERAWFLEEESEVEDREEKGDCPFFCLLYLPPLVFLQKRGLSPFSHVLTNQPAR